MIKDAETGAVRFAGAVLSNAWDYSRFLCSDYGIGRYAEVWNGSAVERVFTGSDRGKCDVVEIDATPEVRAAAEAWRAAKEQAEFEAMLAREAAAARKRIEVGRAVVVVKGRKVPHGTKGIVRWMGDSGFGPSVGLKVEGQDKLVFTAASNVERDHSDAALAAEALAAQELAEWQAKKAEADAAAKAQLSKAAVSKGATVTPKSGVYTGQACRVIWTGVRNGAARVGVVPKGSRNATADWLAVEQVA